MLFFTKKQLFSVAFLCIAIIVFFSIFLALANNDQSTSFLLGKKVVVDAGHGGFDGGVVGITGSIESEFTLIIANQLGQLLQEKGIEVIYTRKDEKALGNTKKEDMLRRAEIIKQSNADCVVSIHLNSYKDTTRRGVQVFYDDTGYGKSFANILQLNINAQINAFYSKRSDLAPQKGDLFITKCDKIPSAIIECGFISNFEDERLLKTQYYRDQLCNVISEAIVIAIS